MSGDFVTSNCADCACSRDLKGELEEEEENEDPLSIVWWTSISSSARSSFRDGEERANENLSK